MDEIARAFLSNEATISQRILRAKKKITEAGLTFEVPRGPDRVQRLASVLEVVYLIFNEGYSATAGEDLIRPSLCAEAQRLGRILRPKAVAHQAGIWRMRRVQVLISPVDAGGVGPVGVG